MPLGNAQYHFKDEPTTTTEDRNGVSELVALVTMLGCYGDNSQKLWA